MNAGPPRSDSAPRPFRWSERSSGFSPPFPGTVKDVSDRLLGPGRLMTTEPHTLSASPQSLSGRLCSVASKLRAQRRRFRRDPPPLPDRRHPAPPASGNRPRPPLLRTTSRWWLPGGFGRRELFPCSDVECSFSAPAKKLSRLTRIRFVPAPRPCGTLDSAPARSPAR